MPKRRVTFLIGLFMFIASNIIAQDADLNPLPDVATPDKLVDFPTAGTLPRASFNVELDAFSRGGILSFINIGLHERFTLGISYGGTGILGDQDPDWNKRPEYKVKLRLIDESYAFPAIAIGFESQGTGFYDDDLDRYQFKAPGFYLVASKGYRAYNWVSGIHAGAHINTLEDNGDGDDDPSFFVGFDITFNNNLSIVGEYQAAFNDNSDSSPYGTGRGYLNMGVLWTFSDQLQLGAIFKDILDNSGVTESITRELRITYMERF